MDERTKNFVKARSKAMAALAQIIHEYDLAITETTLMLLQIATKWQDGVVHEERKLTDPDDTDNTEEHLQEVH